MQMLAILGGAALILYGLTAAASAARAGALEPPLPGLVLAADSAPESTPGYAPASSFTLTDQYNRWHTYHFPRQKVSFLAMADQAGSAQLEDWIQPVYERYRDRIEIHGVAAMPDVPESFRGLVRLFFKGRLAYPVLLDWDSRVAQRYRYQQEQANVFIIDSAGQIRLRMSGAVQPASLQRVFSLVDRLLLSPCGPAQEHPCTTQEP